MPIQVRGLRDVQGGGLITRGFRTAKIEPSKIEQGLVPGWRKIDDPTTLSVRPVMRLDYADVYSDAAPGAGYSVPEGIEL
jgi:hypothetical protein